MREKPITIVFQMAKVASQSWYQAITTADPQAPVYHLHFASPEALSLFRGLAQETGPRQTIKRPRLLMHRSVIRQELAARFAGGRWTGGPVRIVTGIREPVDRSLSLLLFIADFY